MERTNLQPLSLKNFKAVIFDMDGTMVNNSHYHKDAWIEFLKLHGIKLSEDEYIQKISGRRNKVILEMIFGKSLSRDQFEKYSEEKEAIYRKIYAPDIKEVPGLSDIIQKFKNKGLKLAIATTSPVKNRQFVLESLGHTNTFSIILGDEHVENGKPHPEIYLKVARELQVEPNECLVFEDTPVGVEAGKNAGMTVIGILSRHTKEELNKADMVVNDFSQLNIQ